MAEIFMFLNRNFLDFDFFEKYGKSVTGDEYLRFENGPVPRMGEKLLKVMGGKTIGIKIKKIGDGYKDQQCIEPLKPFGHALFSKEEILMMEEVAAKWEHFTGTEMKMASHGEAPWIATAPDKVIDYNLAYCRNKYGEMDKI